MTVNRCIEDVEIVKTPSSAPPHSARDPSLCEKSGPLPEIHPRIEAGTPETNCYPLIIKPIASSAARPPHRLDALVV